MGTFAASGAVLAKAGKNVSSDFDSIWTNTSEYESWLSQAEAVVNIMSRYDWVENSGAIATTQLPILKEATANLAAIEAIRYDMSGYTSRGEAEDMITVLRDAAIRDISLLKDQKGVTFVK